MKMPPWSFTSLDTFETCPKKYYHSYIAKDVPYVETPEMAEGKKVHTALEYRVARNTPLPAAYMMYEPLAASIVNAAAASGGEIRTELKTGLNSDLKPVDFFAKDVWARGALDVTILTPARMPVSAFIGDWKTGKPREKDLQLKTFGFFIFHTYPTIEKVDASNIWLKTCKPGDHYRYYRSGLPLINQEILSKVAKVDKACETETFPEKQNFLCKGWCDVKTCKFWEPKKEKR